MTIKVLNEPSPKLLTTWYAEQVTQGKIKTSKYVKKECERHLRYLENGGKWVFDEELAHRPIRFIEKFCKPSKGSKRQLVLQPWQHFIIGSLFGWVHKETKLRRFREALIFMGRKNGKTTTISGVANYGVSQDGENGAEIHLLANVMKQARILFDESKAMIKASPILSREFRPLRDEIHYDKTISKIMPQASDSDKLDGLNTHMGIFDEIHEFKDYKLIVDMVEMGRDILDGVIEDERTFYYLASLDDDDDMNDSSNWIKANPNLGVSIDLEEMKEEWEKAKRTPAERGDFITKRFNIFANNDEMSFIDYQTLQKNNDVIALDDLEGRPCTIGYDLSETEDFTAACATFALDNGKVAVLSHSWIPKHKVEYSNEKIPYREWEEDGLLTVQDKPYIDYQDVLNWIIKMNEHYVVEKITYDRANAFKLNQELKNYGFETEETRQGALTLSPALKDLKEMFLDGKIIFNNNPLMKWYINNVQLKLDRNGNWLPSKQSRYRKIDGFAAFLNTYTDIMNKVVSDSGEGNIEFISIKDIMR